MAYDELLLKMVPICHFSSVFNNLKTITNQFLMLYMNQITKMKKNIFGYSRPHLEWSTEGSRGQRVNNFSFRSRSTYTEVFFSKSLFRHDLITIDIEYLIVNKNHSIWKHHYVFLKIW